MALDLRANTAVDVLIGPFLDDTDGKTAETGLTIAQADVRLSKNGQNMAQKNDDTAASHDELGYYNCELDATDTNTEGSLVLAVHSSGALPVFHEYNILAEGAWDSLYVANDDGLMDVNVSTIAANAITAAAINADAITSAKIADNALANEHFADGALTSTEITSAAGCAVASIAENAITATSINADAITEAKIADNAIAAEHIAAAAIDNATFAADVGSTEYATNILALAVRKALDEINLDHLMKVAVADRDTLAEVVDDTVLANILTKTDGDTSDFDHSTDSLEALRDHIGDGTNLTEAGGDGDHLTEAGGDGDHLTEVTVAALDNNVITAASINADAITEAKIADNALANEHFAAGALTSTEITSAAGCAVASIAEDAITNTALNANAATEIATAVWDSTEAITGNTNSFESMVTKLFRFFMNDMNITDATGAVALRNEANDADIATQTITDNDTTTTRTDLVWS